MLLNYYKCDFCGETFSRSDGTFRIENPDKFSTNITHYMDHGEKRDPNLKAKVLLVCSIGDFNVEGDICVSCLIRGLQEGELEVTA